MPRPISWLSRLHEIRRTVSQSVRSHYDRHDLEMLFQLQPRAAQKLLEMLPTIAIGTSKLVDREVLIVFLERVRRTEDTTTLYESMRQEKVEFSRKRKLRSLVRRDQPDTSLSALPSSMELKPGQLTVNFASTEELAEALYLLARVLESAGDEFALTYEIKQPTVDVVAGEMDGMFAELERMEALYRG